MVMRRTLMTLAVDARAAWFRYKACFFTFAHAQERISNKG